MTGATPFWTDAKCAELRELVASSRNLSVADIGAALGCSRNSAIGKIRRLGLDLPVNAGNRPPPQPRKPRVRRPASAPNAVEAPPTDLAEPIPKSGLEFDASIPREQLKTLLELENNECRWAVDYVSGAYLFCASPVREGQSWCGAHCRRAFNPGAYKNALRPIR